MNKCDQRLQRHFSIDIGQFIEKRLISAAELVSAISYSFVRLSLIKISDN